MFTIKRLDCRKALLVQGAYPVARKSLFERSRCDTSLVLLTKGFAELLNRSTDGVLDLNVVAQELSAPKRRVYDVTNVLEGIKLLKKKSKNTIQWLGGQVTTLAEELKSLTEEEKYLDELIQIHICLWLSSLTLRITYAYLTYEDVNMISILKEQTVIVIKAPPETNLEVPHPEEVQFSTSIGHGIVNGVTPLPYGLTERISGRVCLFAFSMLRASRSTSEAPRELSNAFLKPAG
uniref:E2F/DP family winged-helix DNA-binding domain-containing protein n=1 Tax=Acanthochromis polyacanthus TaxID=80966 RepID=A0A3Q1FNU3_9TELE